MVFHRYLTGLPDREALKQFLLVGEKLRPWNPFAEDEPATAELPVQRF